LKPCGPSIPSCGWWCNASQADDTELRLDDTEERIAQLESLLSGAAHQVQREPLNELAA